ncbi:hypothetical protein D3C72_740040 [compost metagenome]
MLPDAPERFSTMTGWPSDWVRPSDSTRARMSVDPPAAHGTISVMGFSGQAAWDKAGVARARPSAHTRSNRWKFSFMVFTPVKVPVWTPAGWKWLISN